MVNRFSGVDKKSTISFQIRIESPLGVFTVSGEKGKKHRAEKNILLDQKDGRRKKEGEKERARERVRKMER